MRIHRSRCRLNWARTNGGSVSRACQAEPTAPAIAQMRVRRFVTAEVSASGSRLPGQGAANPLVRPRHRSRGRGVVAHEGMPGGPRMSRPYSAAMAVSAWGRVGHSVAAAA